MKYFVGILLVAISLSVCSTSCSRLRSKGAHNHKRDFERSSVETPDEMNKSVDNGYNANANQNAGNYALEYEPITQYIIVEIVDGSPQIRRNIDKSLKNRNFKILSCEKIEGGNVYELEAKRSGRSGTTTVIVHEYGDYAGRIDFGTPQELQAFIESMRVSKWRYNSSDNSYRHPQTGNFGMKAIVDGQSISFYYV